MATQTTTQRQAAAKKAADTRKQNAAKESAAHTKASARRTSTSARKSAKTTSQAARSTSRNARSTAKQATRTAARGIDAQATRLEAIARQAERVALIPVGAALEARDAVVDTVRTYTDSRTAKRQLDRFERRGANALRRDRQSLERTARATRRDIEQRTDGLRSGASSLVDEVRTLI
jgi:hypothetical protein